MKIKGFYHLKSSWYAKSSLAGSDYTDEIMIGIFLECEDGSSDGCVAEMALRWYNIGGRSTPCLEVFNDAFCLLTDLPEIAPLLKKWHDIHINADTVKLELSRLGFKDRTATKSPYDTEEYRRALALAKLNEDDKKVLGL